MEIVEENRDTEGSIDFCWPEEDQDGAWELLCSLVTETLYSRGYCVLEIPGNDTSGQDVRSLKRGREFTGLSSKTSEAYLGCSNSRTKVACISRELDSAEPLSACVRKVSALGEYLSFVSQQAFGFAAAEVMQGHSGDGVMLREESPCDRSSSAEILQYEEGEESHDDAASVLNFMRRRKLCFMYFLQGCDGGVIQLKAWEDASFCTVSLPVSSNRMLIFRHDLLNYTYQPAGIDLVLQAWVLQEPLVWPGGALTGNEEDIKAVLRARGAPMPSINHVQVKSVGCRIGGKGTGPEATENVYLYMTDCFVKIPQIRWDHDLYWTPNRDDGRGLSGVRHSGLCDDNDMCAFDNVFFGLDSAVAAAMSPSNFMNLECAYETLHLAKYTKRTLRGANIDIAIGGNSRDGDFVHRAMNNLGDQTTIHYLEGDLIKFFLGLGGKSYLIDTACSASNVAFQCVYQEIRRGLGARNYAMINEMAEDVKGLAMGSMYVNDAGAFVGLSQAHMLGNTGRSKTFDNSADGYARGEGVGAAFLKRDDDTFDNFGFVLGGITNQDGRSASLTAPNGPSQSAVIQGSLKDSGRHYLDVNVSELHGTGTAIGDPIETGSLRNVMFPQRHTPIIHQGGKSMTGHLEFGAGVTGIIKTLMCGMHSTATGNCHLKFLNANVDANGYPGIWPNEIVDLNRELNHCGISSFGFGGSNARVDLWAHCKVGGHKIAPVAPVATGFLAVIDRTHRIDATAVDVSLVACSVCSRSMCWMCGEIEDVIAHGKHTCKVVRESHNSYDKCSLCYAGAYLTQSACSGDAGDPGRSVYIVGSWCNFMKYEKMRWTGIGYVLNVELCNLRYAEFRLVLDKTPELSLYPREHRSSREDVPINGPDGICCDRNWVIDVGSFQEKSRCNIEFRWDYDGKKSISWGIVDGSQKMALQKHAQSYTLVGTIGLDRKWQSQELYHSHAEDGLWETTFSIGFTGSVEFQIMVDRDSSQIIHPDGCKVVDVSVALMGPSPASSDKTWFFMGLIGEEVKLQLRNNADGMSLTVSSNTVGSRTWYARSESSWRQHQYYLTGTFNDWILDTPMEPHATSQLAYVQHLVIGGSKSEYLKIVVDKDPTKTLQNCILDGRLVQYSCEVIDGSIKYGLHGPAGCKVLVMLCMRREQPELLFQMIGIDETYSVDAEAKEEDLSEN